MKILCAISAVLLTQVACQKIVQVNNTLSFFNNATHEFSMKFDMINFKFTETEESNLKLNGTFCFAETYEEYVSICREPLFNRTKQKSDWIVANPFDRSKSNHMIKHATNYTESRIAGLIFISDKEITAQKRYDYP